MYVMNMKYHGKKHWLENKNLLQKDCPLLSFRFP